MPKRKETVYKEQLIVETDRSCLFYLYNADGDIEEHSAKDVKNAKSKIDERLESEGLYDADGNLQKNTPSSDKEYIVAEEHLHGETQKELQSTTHE